MPTYRPSTACSLRMTQAPLRGCLSSQNIQSPCRDLRARICASFCKESHRSDLKHCGNFLVRQVNAIIAHADILKMSMVRPSVAMRGFLMLYVLCETGAHSHGAFDDFTPPDCAHLQVFHVFAHDTLDSPAAFATALGSRFGDTIAAWVKTKAKKNPAAQKCVARLCDKRREVLCVSEHPRFTRFSSRLQISDIRCCDLIVKVAITYNGGYVNLR